MCACRSRNQNVISGKHQIPANSYQLQHLSSVVLNSTGAPSSKAVAAAVNRSTDILDRSIRLYGIPPKTQEGLLQQALEKIAPVRKVEIFQDVGQASVELASAAVSHTVNVTWTPLLIFSNRLCPIGCRCSALEKRTVRLCGFDNHICTGDRYYEKFNHRRSECSR